MSTSEDQNQQQALEEVATTLQSLITQIDDNTVNVPSNIDGTDEDPAYSVFFNPSESQGESETNVPQITFDEETYVPTMSEMTTLLITELKSITQQTVAEVQEKVQKRVAETQTYANYLVNRGKKYFTDIKEITSDVATHGATLLEFARTQKIRLLSSAYDQVIKWESTMREGVNTVFRVQDYSKIIKEHEKMIFIAIEELVFLASNNKTYLDATEVDFIIIKNMIKNALNKENLDADAEPEDDKLAIKKEQIKDHVSVAVKTFFFFKHGKSAVADMSVVSSVGASSSTNPRINDDLIFMPRSNEDIQIAISNLDSTGSVNKILNDPEEYLHFLATIAYDILHHEGRNDYKYYGKPNNIVSFVESQAGDAGMIRLDLDSAIAKNNSYLAHYVGMDNPNKTGRSLHNPLSHPNQPNEWGRYYNAVNRFVEVGLAELAELRQFVNESAKKKYPGFDNSEDPEAIAAQIEYIIARQETELKAIRDQETENINSQLENFTAQQQQLPPPPDGDQGVNADLAANIDIPVAAPNAQQQEQQQGIKRKANQLSETPPDSQESTGGSRKRTAKRKRSYKKRSTRARRNKNKKKKNGKSNKKTAKRGKSSRKRKPLKKKKKTRSRKTR
jgi:hypothetical protein